VDVSGAVSGCSFMLGRLKANCGEVRVRLKTKGFEYLTENVSGDKEARDVLTFL